MTVASVSVGNLRGETGTVTEVLTKLNTDGIQLSRCKFVGDGTSDNLTCIHDQDTTPESE